MLVSAGCPPKQQVPKSGTITNFFDTACPSSWDAHSLDEDRLAVPPQRRQRGHVRLSLDRHQFRKFTRCSLPNLGRIHISMIVGAAMTVTAERTIPVIAKGRPNTSSDSADGSQPGQPSPARPGRAQSGPEPERRSVPGRPEPRTSRPRGNRAVNVGLRARQHASGRDHRTGRYIEYIERKMNFWPRRSPGWTVDWPASKGSARLPELFSSTAEAPPRPSPASDRHH